MRTTQDLERNPSTAAEDSVLEELRAALAPSIQVVERLGAGGMGIVYLGRDMALKRLVAIKVLTPDVAATESARLRFAREAEAAAALDHPNVVSIYQVGTLPTSGAAYFIMQFVEGRTLGEAYPPGQPAPNGIARRIVGEVASALGAAHAKGLVHRDVKPSNIILETATGRAVVVDFGISSILDTRVPDQTTSPKLTATGMYIGTPSHMSPEQAAGEPVSDRSDVYSLGVVGFELLAGHPPFTGRSAMELIAAHIKDKAPSILESRPDADPELTQLIDACLGKDPEKRPRAIEIAKFLLPTHQALEWPPPGLEPLHGRGSRLTAALGGAAVVLWCLFGTLLLQSTRTTVCCWGDFEGNSVFGGVRSLLRTSIPLRVDETSLGTIFGMVIVMTVVALPFLIAIVGRRAWSVASAWRRGRVFGYRARLLASVAWDRHRDTAALVNGVEIFALASDDERARFLRLRRWEAVLLAAAVVDALLLPIVWASGIDPDLTTSLLTQRELFLMVLPFLGLMIGAAVVAHPEQTFRQKSRARIKRRPTGAAIRTDVMHDWMTRAGETPAPRRRSIHPALVAAIVAILVVPMGVITAFAAATLLYVGTRLDQVREATINVEKKGLPDRWAATRKPAAPVYLARWNDERAGLVPVAFAGRDTIAIASIVHDTGLTRRYPVVRNVDQGEWNALVMRYRTVSAIPDTALSRLGRNPGVDYWRAFAHGPQPRFLWYARAPRDLSRDLWGLSGAPGYLPMLSWNLQNVVDDNRAAAVLAFRHGDRAEAVLRLRENITGLRYLNAAGIGPFSITIDPNFLEDFGKAAGDSALAREALAVRMPLPIRSWEGDPPMLFEDPTRPRHLALIADTTRSFRVRWLVMSQIVPGFCYNAREIMFGVDPRRLAILDSAERLLKDIDRPELVTAKPRAQLHRWIDDPVGMAELRQVDPDRGLFRMVRLIGPRGAAARLAYCKTGMEARPDADLRGIFSPVSPP